VAGAVLVIAVTAGIVLSITAIALGLFMLLTKGYAGEAEGEWPGKVKVKGPIGLFVFCIGAALLVITMRQITTTPPGSAGHGNADAAPTPGGTQVEFISPRADSEINAGENVSGSILVAGLGNNKIWIVSRHDVGGSYYPIYPPSPKMVTRNLLTRTWATRPTRATMLSISPCWRMRTALRPSPLWKVFSETYPRAALS
jgi:hypothetical protein